MDDVLRKRLSAEELQRYDKCDRWASFAAHLVVWPGFAAFAFFVAGNGPVSLACFTVAAVAFPVVVIMGRRAGALRVAAEERYAAIMGAASDAERDGSRDKVRED